MRPTLISLLLAAWIALGASGCSPQIGDGCGNPTNCSINGDRACDLSQPNGYCTVLDCQPDRCPNDAVCARFNPLPARRATTACMRRCESDGDCRSEYRCMSVEDLACAGLDVVITDTNRGPKFCVARVDMPEGCVERPVDAGVDASFPVDAETPDAETPDASELDAETPDAETSDAGSDDAGSDDAGSDDAGSDDAGSDDAGSDDAGSDAGATDAGSDDAGATDAGSDDAGSDAGSTDAGSDDAA